LKKEEDSKDIVAVTSSMFISKLGLNNVAIATAKQLGKYANKTDKSWLLLVYSQTEKNRTKLAGSDIYISFDLCNQRANKRASKSKEITKETSTI